MNILWFGFIAVTALVFLIAHCYLYRGLRVTLTFFISCFFYSILKENAIYYMETVMAHPKPPYEIINPAVLIFHAPLVVCVGWLVAIYTSWSLAESILKKIELFSGKIFPTLLLGGLIAAAVSYCVEATGIAAGWWRWTRSDMRLSDFLAGIPISPLGGWFFMFLSVMAPYFLIECSKYRVKKWRYIFILPTFLYLAIRFSGNSLLALIIECAAIIVLFFLALRSRLLLTGHFKKGRGFYPGKYPQVARFMNNAPFFMALLMLIVMIFIDLKVVKQPELLISAIPIVVFMMLPFFSIFFWMMFCPVFTAVFWGEKKIIVTIIPVIIFLAGFMISKFSTQRINKESLNE